MIHGELQMLDGDTIGAPTHHVIRYILVKPDSIKLPVCVKYAPCKIAVEVTNFQIHLPQVSIHPERE